LIDPRQRDLCTLYFFCDFFANAFYTGDFTRGPIAQVWLERTPDKREVTGSTPVRPTGCVRSNLDWSDQEVASDLLSVGI
jgi:hypothetical protein